MVAVIHAHCGGLDVHQGTAGGLRAPRLGKRILATNQDLRDHDVICFTNVTG
jgi:hypothetical protein